MTPCTRPAPRSRKAFCRAGRGAAARKRGAQEGPHPQRRPEDRRRDRSQGDLLARAQIAINAGEDGSIVVGKILEKDTYAYGYDAQAGEYGNLISKGIIDPTKVVRAALQGAASVAGLLITTEAMVAELPKKQSLAMAGGPGGGMDF